MNNQESLEFIREYFDELFGKRNLAALDRYLDESYFDDDIADPNVDHIQDSKNYLLALFQAKPSIGVEVIDTMTHDNVITAFIEWFVCEGSVKKAIRKGVGIFVVKDGKILKRHNYIYYNEG
jgi:hypothetical protein